MREAGMSDILTKCCSKCGEEKPATNEFFHCMKQSKDGLSPSCKVCTCKTVLEGQRCPEMHVRKLTYMKVYNGRPEVRARNTAWRTRPENLAKRLAYEKRLEVREHKRAYDKAKRTRPETQEREAAYRKVYSRRPERKARQRVHSRTRDAHKKAIGGTYTVQQIQDLLKRQK